MKNIFILGFLMSSSLVFAMDVNQVGMPEEPEDTALLVSISKKPTYKDILLFQAAEKKVFYQDLAREKKDLTVELMRKKEALLTEQRENRKNFVPQNHTIEERREFFVGQREEMKKFKSDMKDSLNQLAAEQKKKREEFHAKQKDERKNFKENKE